MPASVNTFIDRKSDIADRYTQLNQQTKERLAYLLRFRTCWDRCIDQDRTVRNIKRMLIAEGVLKQGELERLRDNHLDDPGLRWIPAMMKRQGYGQPRFAPATPDDADTPTECVDGRINDSRTIDSQNNESVHRENYKEEPRLEGPL